MTSELWLILDMILAGLLVGLGWAAVASPDLRRSVTMFIAFGLLLAFGMYFPKRRVMLLIPPIPMPAWLFVTAYGLLELYHVLNDLV